VQSGGVSSLIFLVVIGVWAAYFIQYWVRRRDHLATARSVDQFSESMRVLERRSALSGADATTPQRDSSAVSPLQPARAQLLLRRAAVSSAAVEREAVGPMGTDRRDAVDAVAARRNRVMVLIGALSTWLVAVPLVVLGLLGVAYLAVPVVSLVVAMAWMRHSAGRARAVAASRATTPVRARPSERDMRTTSREFRGSPPVAQPRPEPIATADVEAGIEVGLEAALGTAIEQPAEPTQAAVASRARDELYDLEAVEAVASAAASPTAAPAADSGPAQTAAQWGRYLVDEDDIPLTWDPVPVPRPTYTLKARATRPAPTAADLVGDADTEYASHTDELPVRQVAGA